MATTVDIMQCTIPIRQDKFVLSATFPAHLQPSITLGMFEINIAPDWDGLLRCLRRQATPRGPPISSSY